MNRREYLQRIGASTTLGVVALAGCGSPEGGAEETPGATAEPTEQATPAQTTAGDGTGTATADEGTPVGTETDGAGTATEGQPGTTTGGGTATASGLPTRIAMLTSDGDNIFDPIGLYVEPGSTITWVNESGAHSATAYTAENPGSEVRRIPDDAEGWNSETLAEGGAEFSHTFDVEGTYDYYCIPHKSLEMVGRLVVGQPSGYTGDPPDGPVPSEETIIEQGVVTQADFNA